MAGDDWNTVFARPAASLRLITSQAIVTWMPVSNHFGPHWIHPGGSDEMSGTLLHVGTFEGSRSTIDKVELTDTSNKTTRLAASIRWINIFPSTRAASPTKPEALRALTPNDTEYNVFIEQLMVAQIPATWPAKLQDAARNCIRARRLHCAMTDPNLIVAVWHSPDGYALRTRSVSAFDEYDFNFYGAMTVETYEEVAGPIPRRIHTHSGVQKIEVKANIATPHIGFHQDPPWPTEP